MVLTVTTAAFFSALGFAAWIAGHIFGQKGIATIGGAIVVILGAFVATGGLHYQSGQVQDHDIDVVEVNGTNQTILNGTTVRNQYRPLSQANQYRVGFVVLLLGTAMTLRGLNMDQPL